MVHRRQSKPVRLRHPRRNRRRRCQALPIPSPKHIRRHHQLVPAHPRLPSHLIRIHIDHLHHPVRIRPRRRCHQVRHRLPAHLHRGRQHIRHKHRHIRPPRLLRLIVRKPVRHVIPGPYATRMYPPSTITSVALSYPYSLDPRCALWLFAVKAAALYGVRVSSIPTPFAPFGIRITDQAQNLTRSRLQALKIRPPPNPKSLKHLTFPLSTPTPP